MNTFWTDLIGKVVRFKDTDSHEINFDDGMMARITAVTPEVHGCVEVFFDHSEFEEQNRVFAKNNYYDDKGVPCETWFQQSYYSVKCSWCFDENFEKYPPCFEVVEGKGTKPVFLTDRERELVYSALNFSIGKTLPDIVKKFA